MKDYNFDERLAWSKGIAGQTDADTIASILPGCVSVVAAPTALDLKGIDYVATLRRGAAVNIDVKRRTQGVGKWWTNRADPELTLEKWSVCPGGTEEERAGWTLDEAKATDYVLYVFDKADTLNAFLLPFQLLRMAFRTHGRAWYGDHKVGRCCTDGGRYETESVFVPASIVLDAVTVAMRMRA